MAQQSFRSALNGFNREDVVSYIEYLNSVHAAEINQLRSELEFFRNKQPVEMIPESVEDNNVQLNEVIEQQASRIRELFDRCKELEAQVAQAEEAKNHAEEKLQAVLTQQNTLQTRAGEELEAYRRAERTERMARERAEQVYRTANGVLADATVRVDEAASKISEMSDQVMFQLNLLESAVSGSKQALKDAAATMYAIRPGNEE